MGAHLVHVEGELVAYLVDRALFLFGFALQFGVGVGIRRRLLVSERCNFPCLGISLLSPARIGRDGTSRTCLALNRLLLPILSGEAGAVCADADAGSCRCWTVLSRESSSANRSSTRSSSTALFGFGGVDGARILLTLFFLEPIG